MCRVQSFKIAHSAQHNGEEKEWEGGFLCVQEVENYLVKVTALHFTTKIKCGLLNYSFLSWKPDKFYYCKNCYFI